MISYTHKQGKIIYTDKETKIQTKGLNVEKLKALIESNLEELLAN